uniref:Zinc finger protein 268 n=1 Tax=Catagonus wagneri TaxID=51154 RepID=A0A8C3WNP6_9CETA
MAARVRTAAIWGINTPNPESFSSWNKKSHGCKSQLRAIQIKCGKLVILNGIGKIKASREVIQKAISVLHLENYAFLVQIMFLQDKSFINVSHMKRV